MSKTTNKMNDMKKTTKKRDPINVLYHKLERKKKGLQHKDSKVSTNTSFMLSWAYSMFIRHFKDKNHAWPYFNLFFSD